MGVGSGSKISSQQYELIKQRAIRILQTTLALERELQRCNQNIMAASIESMEPTDVHAMLTDILDSGDQTVVDEISNWYAHNVALEGSTP